MSHKKFLWNVGEKVLFQTMSSGVVYNTTTATYISAKRRDQQLSNDIIKSEEGLNYLIEYFGLGEEYDGDLLKNMYNFYLKRKLDK